LHVVREAERVAFLGVASMDLDSLDLKMLAVVHWRNPLPHKPELGAKSRRFTSVANAVRFVMEDLTDFPQSTASISAGAVELTFEQIKELYGRIILQR
jgi:hypothetical protein